jgi:hypothetical protein
VCDVLIQLDNIRVIASRWYGLIHFYSYYLRDTQLKKVKHANRVVIYLLNMYRNIKLGMYKEYVPPKCC